MAVRLDVTPDPPRAGRTTLLTLRTFTPYARAGGGFRLEPAVASHYPFRVSATSNGSPRLRITVERSDDPYAWVGFVRFPRTGRWTIRVENFGPRYEAAAGAVLRASSPPATDAGPTESGLLRPPSPSFSSSGPLSRSPFADQRGPFWRLARP